MLLGLLGGCGLGVRGRGGGVRLERKVVEVERALVGAGERKVARAGGLGEVFRREIELAVTEQQAGAWHDALLVVGGRVVPAKVGEHEIEVEKEHLDEGADQRLGELDERAHALGAACLVIGEPAKLEALTHGGQRLFGPGRPGEVRIRGGKASGVEDVRLRIDAWVELRQSEDAHDARPLLHEVGLRAVRDGDVGGCDLR
mmetsp:Transcript_28960/g.72707  ORF Transcript_28960/g.72707 Transcript_28960/m.72707 type:complete len:201 (+) Transcript_28960:177-779(+)